MPDERGGEFLTDPQIETAYVNKWRALDRHVPREDFRFFSRYIGLRPNIVPESLCHNRIEPVLNPVEYRAYYEDKNIYDRLFPAGWLPATLLRNLRGRWTDADYTPVSPDDGTLYRLCSPYDRFVVKPSVESGSGRGVRLFERHADGLYRQPDDREILTVDLLKRHYGQDFIVQEALRQSRFMAGFCTSSVNTLRVTTYRSVITERIEVLSIVLRIGHEGAVVDNFHGGGMIVGVHSDGRVGQTAVDDSGARHPIHHAEGAASLRLPQIGAVTEFAVEIARRIDHHRLLALDIAIDENDKPRLIEFNVSSYGIPLAQMTLGPTFGHFTDEIIDYCREHRRQAHKVFVRRT